MRKPHGNKRYSRFEIHVLEMHVSPLGMKWGSIQIEESRSISIRKQTFPERGSQSAETIWKQMVSGPFGARVLGKDPNPDI